MSDSSTDPSINQCEIRPPTTSSANRTVEHSSEHDTQQEKSSEALDHSLSVSHSVNGSDVQDASDAASLQDRTPIKRRLYGSLEKHQSRDSFGSRDSLNSFSGPHKAVAGPPPTPAPQYDQHDSGTEGLQAQPKHVFVFSSAGKPVFSLHGDESELAGLMATAQALMSVAQSSGQQLRHVRYIGVPAPMLPLLHAHFIAWMMPRIHVLA